jgi:hypothetical protein
MRAQAQGSLRLLDRSGGSCWLRGYALIYLNGLPAGPHGPGPGGP